MSKNRYRPEANPDRIDRVLARRRSNAAGIHGDRRLKRLRTRGNVRVSLRKEAVA
jgi:hypothetical protein